MPKTLAASQQRSLTREERSLGTARSDGETAGKADRASVPEQDGAEEREDHSDRATAPQRTEASNVDETRRPARASPT